MFRVVRERPLVPITAVAALIAVGAVTTVTADSGTAGGTVVTITPVRVLDTRDGVDVGLTGPFASGVSQDLRVTGSIPTTVGPTTVVPEGADGVVLNVTAVLPTADGFVSVRPADAPGAPATSNLNVLAGDITPNAVTVAVPTSGPDAGVIELTYDAYGAAGPVTDLLVDVVAYTSSSTLDDLAAQLVDKVDAEHVAAAVATRMPAAPLVTTSHGAAGWTNGQGGHDDDERPLHEMSGGGMSATVLGSMWMPLDGPAALGATSYTLSSVTYCIENIVPIARVDAVAVLGHRATTSASGGFSEVTDATDRHDPGCHTIQTNAAVRARESFSLRVDLAGVLGAVTLSGVTAVWEPRT